MHSIASRPRLLLWMLVLLPACSGAPDDPATPDVPVDAGSTMDAPPMDLPVVDHPVVDLPAVDRRDTSRDVDLDRPATLQDAGPVDATLDASASADQGTVARDGAPMGVDACGQCVVGPNVEAVECVGGQCVGRCRPGFGDCNRHLGDGCESDLHDPRRCGRCDNVCPVPTDGRAICREGVCGFACNAGYHPCRERCVADDSPFGCGSRCDPCPLPALAAAVTCNAGVCGFVCSPGYHACGDRCVADESIEHCGGGCSPCAAPVHATPSCQRGQCGWSCDTGYVRRGEGCILAPPRPIRPLSAARVNTTRPTLRWQLSPGVSGVRVEIARDRGFMDPVHAFDATGETGTPGLSLAPGVYFWRLRNRVEGVPDESPSPVWEFVVVRRSAMVDTTWGTLPDLNGDGIGDMVVPAVVVGSTMPVAYVYLGTRGTLPTTPTQTLRAPAGTTSIFGRNAAIVPDINGDGFADLVVGRFGSVLVYHGSALGLSVSPTQVLNSVDPGRNFGASVAGLGDVNGDGYGDVVVGATAGEGGGRAYVYWGGGGRARGSSRCDADAPEQSRARGAVWRDCDRCR